MTACDVYQTGSGFGKRERVCHAFSFGVCLREGELPARFGRGATGAEAERFLIEDAAASGVHSRRRLPSDSRCHRKGANPSDRLRSLPGPAPRLAVAVAAGLGV
jgi:hypothetical protein